jgi:ParB family chromosome partitioning protein
MSKFDIDAFNSIEETTTTDENTSEVFISDIKPNPYQPRFKEEVSELAKSIEEHGLLQPITINQDGIIVAGHRRYYAHIELQKEFIKVNRVFADDKKLRELALIENIQREELHPLEIALSIEESLQSGDYKSADDIAKVLSKSKSYISKMRSLLKLPDDIIEDIKYNKRRISVETLSLLVQFKDKEDYLKELFEKYTSGQINRLDIQELLKEYKGKQTSPPQQIKTSSSKLKLNFNWKGLSDEDKNDMEIEIQNILDKYERKL